MAKEKPYICNTCKRYKVVTVDGNITQECMKKLTPKVKYGGGWKCARFINVWSPDDSYDPIKDILEAKKHA